MVEVTGLCLRPGTQQGQEEDLRQAAVEQGLSPRGGSGNKPCEVTLEAQPGVHQLRCPPDSLPKATNKFSNILPRQWPTQGRADPRLGWLCAPSAQVALGDWPNVGADPWGVYFLKPPTAGLRVSPWETPDLQQGRRPVGRSLCFFGCCVTQGKPLDISGPQIPSC